MNGVLYQARIALIRIGKVLPFVVCAIVMLSYAETAFALATSAFVEWDGYVVPYKPITWLIGLYFEYNLQTLVVLCVLSIAIRTCIYNKLACAYLGVNLLEKWYFDFELDIICIYIICLANIIVAGYLTYKGIIIILKH